MMSYTLTQYPNLVIRDSDGKKVLLLSDANPDCEQYKAWLAAGNAPTPAPIQPQIQLAIVKTYADVDAVYFAAVGNREEEYKDAEVAARAFKVAGYAGTVSPYISHWATVKGITDQQSADSIIAKADALAAAKLALRNTRFDSQAAMTAATTQAQLDAAVASWNAFIAATKTSLGLP